jgi:hypothetical protein
MGNALRTAGAAGDQRLRAELQQALPQAPDLVAVHIEWALGR